MVLRKRGMNGLADGGCRERPFSAWVRHVAVIAPAGPVSRRAVGRGVDLLHSWGLRVTVGAHVFGPSPFRYLAAAAAERYADLRACWLDSSVDLAICARGGFGSAQLLPLIEWDLIKSRGLPVLGYSDITALGLALHGVGNPVVAGPVAVKMPDDLAQPTTMRWFKRAMAGKKRRWTIPRRFGVKTINPGIMAAPVVPVNLTVACSLVGTPFMPSLAGKILLIEDVNEPVYALDRLLGQLAMAGILRECAGLVFGKFKNCGTAAERRRLFTKFARETGLPTLAQFPFGHVSPIISIPYGALMNVGADGEVSLEL